MKNIMDHIENFIDDETAALEERAKNFVAQTGLDQVESLVTDPNAKDLAPRVLERLSPFFEGGLLIQSGMVTDLFWRGNVFRLGPKDRIHAENLLPEITATQVHKASARKVLSALGLDFMIPAGEGEGYLMKPTPTVGYVLFSGIAAPWASDHVAHAHRLINKCFIF
jgi:hypothetical protein